jgi:hypothetical protein
VPSNGLCQAARRRLGGRFDEDRDMRRSVVATLRRAMATLALAAGACVYDADDRCSINEVLVDDTRCECSEGSAYTPYGCVLCGENEVAGPNGCDCADGLSRPTPDADCQPNAPAALGAECNVASAPCGDPRYDHCHVSEGDDGYCTIAGCTTSADCDGGYACEVGAEPPFCRRPLVGLGRPCQSPADCAEGEANFCDMLVSHTCLEQGCSLEAQDCFGGQQCCDLSMFGVPVPVCLPPGAC